MSDSTPTNLALINLDNIVADLTKLVIVMIIISAIVLMFRGWKSEYRKIMLAVLGAAGIAFAVGTMALLLTDLEAAKNLVRSVTSL